jgi:hypothetical protein
MNVYPMPVFEPAAVDFTRRAASENPAFIHQLAELGFLLPLAAERLEARVRRLPVPAMLSLRALLSDLFRGAEPGGEKSALFGTTSLEQDLIVDAMIGQLSAAFEDAAGEVDSGAAREVAKDIAGSPKNQRLMMLARWMFLSKLSGVYGLI